MGRMVELLPVGITTYTEVVTRGHDARLLLMRVAVFILITRPQAGTPCCPASEYYMQHCMKIRPGTVHAM